MWPQRCLGFCSCLGVSFGFELWVGFDFCQFLEFLALHFELCSCFLGILWTLNFAVVFLGIFALNFVVFLALSSFLEAFPFACYHRLGTAYVRPSAFPLNSFNELVFVLKA